VGTGNGVRIDRKAGDLVDPGVSLELVESAPFVSRGGEKLAAALDAFGVDPLGRVCLDVGSSTGGFTDCVLQRGASRVYALDVGHGQLAASLRANPRVVSMERTHARRLDPADPEHVRLPEQPTLAVVDVSFISLERVLGPATAQLAPGADIVALVKPQFEAGPRAAVHGVVRDPLVHRAVVERIRAHATSLGLRVADEVESPLLGPAGNREFFLHLVTPAGA
jgi:23S rRNA (cytidine1920-2'-O)/16S rRNA (cytidine1409-2'-O)-methyltransferase